MFCILVICILVKRSDFAKFQGSAKGLSKNFDGSKDLAIVFENSHLALLACQVSLLWLM